LDPGIALFTYSSSGTGAFSVRLIDGDGATLDTIVSSDGAASGSRVVTIPEAGYYLLNVECLDSWQISVG
jgi:hypothetical protein